MHYEPTRCAACKYRLIMVLPALLTLLVVGGGLAIANHDVLGWIVVAGTMGIALASRRPLDSYFHRRWPRHVAPAIYRSTSTDGQTAHHGAPAVRLTEGTRLKGARDAVAQRVVDAARIGQCRTCSKLVALNTAKEVCYDWDGVDAYHYYCPRCYVKDDYYRGGLTGERGEAIVDQNAWFYD